MANLVTGEAVELDLRAAQLPSRMLAFAVDVGIELLLLILLIVGVGEFVAVSDGALAAALVIVLFVAAFVGWPVAWESIGHGRTPGKLMLGLRVVRDDGGPVRFRHSLVRALVGVFADFWVTMGLGALVSSLLSQRGKRIGDLAAGTFVVRERTPRAATTAGMAYAPMPPQLAAWAATLDLSAYPDDLALATRQFLGRAAELDPAVAGPLAARLADDTAAALRVAVPPGMHPATFLTVVMAERRRRAYAQAFSAPAGPGWGASPGTWSAPPPGPAAPAPGPGTWPGTAGPVPVPGTWPGTGPAPAPGGPWASHGTPGTPGPQGAPVPPAARPPAPPPAPPASPRRPGPEDPGENGRAGGGFTPPA